MFIEITGDSEIIGVYDLSSFNWRVQKTHGHQHPHPWRYDARGGSDYSNHDDETKVLRAPRQRRGFSYPHGDGQTRP